MLDVRGSSIQQKRRAAVPGQPPHRKPLGAKLAVGADSAFSVTATGGASKRPTAVLGTVTNRARHNAASPSPVPALPPKAAPGSRARAAPRLPAGAEFAVPAFHVPGHHRPDAAFVAALHRSAVKIQRWYRGVLEARRAASARIAEIKRRALVSGRVRFMSRVRTAGRPSGPRDPESQEEKRRRRAEKARLARQEALRELQESRAPPPAAASRSGSRDSRRSAAGPAPAGGARCGTPLSLGAGGHAGAGEAGGERSPEDVEPGPFLCRSASITSLEEFVAAEQSVALAPRPRSPEPRTRGPADETESPGETAPEGNRPSSGGEESGERVEGSPAGGPAAKTYAWGEDRPCSGGGGGVPTAGSRGQPGATENGRRGRPPAVRPFFPDDQDDDAAPPYSIARYTCSQVAPGRTETIGVISELKVVPAPPQPPPPEPRARHDTLDTASVTSRAAMTETTVANDETTTDRRIDRILEYLKNVEEADAKDTASAKQPAPRAREGAQEPHAGCAAADLNTAVDLQQRAGPPGSAAFEGVRSKIIGQQIEIEEKTRMLVLLRKELKKLKDVTKEQDEQHKKNMKSKLSLQRKEYETIINRHLSFIDRLLLEKEEISKNCETLTANVKRLETQFKEKSQAFEEQHAKDLRQQKELWHAAEKIKRDKWIQDKTKAIKDQTIKGLEPEIQRMLTQHKQQLKRVEEKLHEDFAKERQLMIEQHARHLDQLRDRMTAERQKACEEERDFARQRYQKQLEREEMEFQQQKRKLAAEFAEQKDALVARQREERICEEEAHRKAIDETKKALQSAREAAEASAEEAKRRHLGELANLREKLAIEKEEWKAQYMAKAEADARAKEKQLREKLTQERDAEIEMVILRLESETDSNASEAGRRHRMEVERLRAHHADEVRQLRDQAGLALDRAVGAEKAAEQADGQKRALQKEVMRLQHESLARDNVVRQQRTELARLRQDEQALSETIRREFEDQLTQRATVFESLQNQLARQQEQAEAAKRRHRAEMEELDRAKAEALEVVEHRVRQALAVKDDLANELRRQLDEATLRNAHLEAVMEKQRQELIHA